MRGLQQLDPLINRLKRRALETSQAAEALHSRTRRAIKAPARPVKPWRGLVRPCRAPGVLARPLKGQKGPDKAS